MECKKPSPVMGGLWHWLKKKPVLFKPSPTLRLQCLHRSPSIAPRFSQRHCPITPAEHREMVESERGRMRMRMIIIQYYTHIQCK